MEEIETGGAKYSSMNSLREVLAFGSPDYPWRMPKSVNSRVAAERSVSS